MARQRTVEAVDVTAKQKVSRVKTADPPRGPLGGLDSEATAALLTAAADVSLVLDAEGIVREVAFGSEEMAQEGYRKWIGQAWVETVTPDSRPKVEALLRDAAGKGAHKWRHVHHTSSRGSDVPVLYSAVQVGQGGAIVAFGRDLRAMATLQQRLVDAQQSMERDYWRLRNVETRFRTLFQMAGEAVLIVDAATDKVIEANPAAGDFLGEATKRVVGRSLADCLGAESNKALQTVLAGVRATGRADDISIRIGADRRELLMSAIYFRQETGAVYLLRMSIPRAEGHLSAIPKAVLKAMEYAPDALLVTDLDGRVIASNRTFVDLAQMASEAQVRGEVLDRWIGRSGVDFSVLMANLRQHGAIRLFASTLTGEHGATAEVEISAVSIPSGDPPCMAFNIRNVGRRVVAESSGGGDIPRSVEQLTELVGRVPLKELVRDATDLIEKLCIEAALQLTHDNRASAAEVLGLSRQSLYVKLRRYGLGDLSPEPDEPPES